MKKILLILVTAGSGLMLPAQDIHYSMFYHTPILMNPALTGAYKGNHRVIVNYKDQWGDLGTPVTYRTTNISYDFALFKKKWQNAYLGGGFDVFSDKAGDAQMGTSFFSGSLSCILKLNDYHRLSAGIQGGYVARTLDANSSSLQWGSQFNGTSYDPSLPSGETGNFESFGYGDSGMGLAWSYGTDESNMISNNALRANFGVAMYHLNKPKLQFSLIDDDKLYSKYVIHGGMYIGLMNTNTAIIPRVFYIRQGPAQETVAGLMFRYTMKEESKVTGFIKETAILLGGYYRIGDAFVPSLEFQYANFALAMSYDVNTSALKAATNGKGGIEIALKFVTPSPFKEATGSKSRFL